MGDRGSGSGQGSVNELQLLFDGGLRFVSKPHGVIAKLADGGVWGVGGGEVEEDAACATETKSGIQQLVGYSYGYGPSVGGESEVFGSVDREAFAA